MDCRTLERSILSVFWTSAIGLVDRHDVDVEQQWEKWVTARSGFVERTGRHLVRRVVPVEDTIALGGLADIDTEATR